MKSYAWNFLRLKFSQLFFSCYVRILEQGSKIHGEKSQSQLCWSISDFLRALLVSFDFDFSDALLKSTSRSQHHPYVQVVLGALSSGINMQIAH